MIKKIFFYSLIYFVVACNTGPSPLATITVFEEDGLRRELEYITVAISSPSDALMSSNLIAIDTEADVSIPVQVIDTSITNDGEVWKVLFPISIAANSSKSIEIHIQKNTTKDTLRRIQLAEDEKAVETDVYKALFSTDKDSRGGQIGGILLKKFENQLLQRGHIPMHWAPNFSRPDSESYYGFEHLPPTSANSTTAGIYQVLKARSGNTDSIPEITISGEYTFFAALPYFHFESEMTMQEDVVLDLLRNDEMTMDSLFTHVIYRPKGGSISQLELYSPQLDELKDNPIPDDADFVGFFNAEKGYGLASIRMKYDNSNKSGGSSPTHKPYTKITRSSGNGRYWNRILTDTVMKFPAGSQYREKNAYLIFDASSENVEKEILYYAERLSNPLRIEFN